MIAANLIADHTAQVSTCSGDQRAKRPTQLFPKTQEKVPEPHEPCRGRSHRYYRDVLGPSAPEELVNLRHNLRARSPCCVPNREGTLIAS